MKMQRALEHADEEKARLEEDLEIAMAAATAATAANSLPPDQQPVRQRMLWNPYSSMCDCGTYDIVMRYGITYGRRQRLSN